MPIYRPSNRDPSLANRGEKISRPSKGDGGYKLAGCVVGRQYVAAAAVHKVTPRRSRGKILYLRHISARPGAATTTSIAEYCVHGTCQKYYEMGSSVWCNVRPRSTWNAKSAQATVRERGSAEDHGALQIPHFDSLRPTARLTNVARRSTANGRRSTSEQKTR